VRLKDANLIQNHLDTVEVMVTQENVKEELSKDAVFNGEFTLGCVDVNLDNHKNNSHNKFE